MWWFSPGIPSHLQLASHGNVRKLPVDFGSCCGFSQVFLATYKLTGHGNVRKLPVTLGYVVVFPGYSKPLTTG